MSKGGGRRERVVGARAGRDLGARFTVKREVRQVRLGRDGEFLGDGWCRGKKRNVGRGDGGPGWRVDALLGE